MPRIDLPEIEDQPWCPAWLRDTMTGYLQVVNDVFRPYGPAGTALSGLLDATGSEEVLDLASGAGGPWPGLIAALRREHPALAVTLSDVHPNPRALEAAPHVGLSYAEEPVSALDIPAQRRNASRTLFTGLHHFDRDEVRAILAHAQRDGVGFAAFEATQRSVRGVLFTAFIPLLVLLLMPRVRPQRLLPLLLTYLPPLLPLAIWWDGLASTLRTHTVEELRSIVSEIEKPGFTWVVEELAVDRGPIPILAVVGHPSLGREP